MHGDRCPASAPAYGGVWLSCNLHPDDHAVTAYDPETDQDVGLHYDETRQLWWVFAAEDGPLRAVTGGA